MTRRTNVAALLGIAIVMTVAGPSICRAQDSTKGGNGPELDSFNFAFMSVLGSGFFSIDGREALILSAPITFTLRDEHEYASSRAPHPGLVQS